MTASPSYKPLYASLGYHFQNEALLKQALSHRSMGAMHNERLEFLGDSLLNCVVADNLYKTYPKHDEGLLTRYRSELVRESSLAELARSWNLGAYLIMGLSERKSGGHRRASILADTVEALIAGIYIESGFLQVHRCISAWMQPALADLGVHKNMATLKDHKTQLQEWIQSQKGPLPLYHLLEKKGADHAPVFMVEVRWQNHVHRAEGESLKIAEQRAAALLCEALEIPCKPLVQESPS